MHPYILNIGLCTVRTYFYVTEATIICFLLTFCHSFAGHVQEELLYINWQIKLNLFRRKIKTDAKPSKNWPARHGNEEKRKIQNIRNITLNLQVLQMLNCMTVHKYSIIIKPLCKSCKSCPKWPVMCRVGQETILTHSLTHVYSIIKVWNNSSELV